VNEELFPIRARKNPFAVRYVRPGAIPFLVPAPEKPRGDPIETMLAKLRRQKWQGQIVGKHGSGKSTLLAEIAHRLHHQGLKVRTFRFDALGGAGVREMKKAMTGSASAKRVFLIDGFDRLSWRQRWTCRRLACRQSVGIVVTTHKKLFLPMLYRTETSVDLLEAIVEHLIHCKKLEAVAISRHQLEECFDRHSGNIRDILFALYDQFEKQIDSSQPVGPIRPE
jgi:hypothetical protein